VSPKLRTVSGSVCKENWFAMMRKALVTGSCGLIGSEVCVYLARSGYSVSGIDFQYRGLACAAAAVLLLPVLLRICRYQSASISLACCVAAALIVAPHAYLYDVALLIPLCLSVTRFGSLRSLAQWLVSPVATYPLALKWAVPGAAFIVFPVLVLLVRIGNRSLKEGHELSPAPLQTCAGASG